MSFYYNKTLVVLGAGIMQKPLITAALNMNLRVVVLDIKIANFYKQIKTSHASKNNTGNVKTNTKSTSKKNSASAKTSPHFYADKFSRQTNSQLKKMWLRSFSHHHQKNFNKLNTSKLHLLPCNFNSVNSAKQHIVQWQNCHSLPPVNAVVTVGTDFSTKVAQLSKLLNVTAPHLPYAAALTCTHKGKMRKALLQAGLLQPAYFLLSFTPLEMRFIKKNTAVSEKTNNRFSTKLQTKIQQQMLANKALLGSNANNKNSMTWPLVIKPVNSMGARGVVKVQSLGQAASAACQAAMHSPTREVIVEEFISGSGTWCGEISVDALIYKNNFIPTGIADRIIGGAPHFIESGHTISSQRSQKVITSCWKAFHQATKALGITHGAAKGDLILAGNGQVVVGEVAARLSGGYMSGYTYPLQSGINLMEEMVRVALGTPPLIMQKKPTKKSLLCKTGKTIVVERAKILPPGKIQSIHGIEEAISLPGVQHLFINQTVGSEIKKAENNLMKFACVIAVGSSLRQANSHAQKALSLLKVIYKP